MLVNEFLEQSAKRLPNKVALVCQGKRLTFSEIDNSANSLANALISQGVERQDRVAIYLENSAESVVSIFCILKAGGIFVVINPQVKAKKLEYILNDCQTPNSKPPEILSYTSLLNKYPANQPTKRCIDIDLASLIYTSGSTGNPKGVMLTHLNMVSAANSIIEYLGNTSDDIILDCLPLSFDYGLYQVLMAFKFGGRVVLERSFTYPYQIIDLIIKEKATGFPIVPTISAILLQLNNLNKYDFSSLRYITNTAQALPPKHIFRLREIFPQVKIYSMYGLTECKRVSYLPPEEIDKRPTSVGKAMPNTETYIVDGNGEKITQPGQI